MSNEKTQNSPEVLQQEYQSLLSKCVEVVGALQDGPDKKNLSAYLDTLQQETASADQTRSAVRILRQFYNSGDYSAAQLEEILARSGQHTQPIGRPMGTSGEGPDRGTDSWRAYTGQTM